ncbi:MAG TPA: hypothetical protein VGR27_05350, partial [Longimicrobiaceae bacterium]|nr:hypothetical protein [Longimicrobiaceae bacterium]
LYAAAGDGWFESRDGGESWQQLDEGLRHHYLWSVAVDPDDPELLLVSAAAGARQAHDSGRAETWIYRRQRGGTWHPVREGLPEPRGTVASSLAADRAEPGIFYAANNHGVFRSVDGGESWSRPEITWPARWRGERVTGVALA